MWNAPDPEVEIVVTARAGILSHFYWEYLIKIYNPKGVNCLSTTETKYYIFSNKSSILLWTKKLMLSMKGKFYLKLSMIDDGP